MRPDFPWLPFATNEQDEQRWLMFDMPSPTEFQTYADCKARVIEFLSSTSNQDGFKAPYGCVYHGNNYYYVWLLNRLYDGRLFDGCLGKTIVSPTDPGSQSLYDPALITANAPAIGTTEAGRSWYCVGWWTAPSVLRSQAYSRQVMACQQHNSGWEYVPEMFLPQRIASFNQRCAALGVKSTCKLVRHDVRIHGVDFLPTLVQACE